MIIMHNVFGYNWRRSRAFLPYRPKAGADPGVEIGGGHMASAEREPIMGVWGLYIHTYIRVFV